MAKTKRSKTKTKTRTKRRPSTTWTVQDWLLMKRIWMTIQDEVVDLAAVLNSVPVLRKMGDIMHDVQHVPASPQTSTPSDMGRLNDQVGQAALRHFGVSLNEQLSQPGKQLVEDSLDLAWDLHRANDYITEAVRWRLYRLEALIGLLKEQKPTQ